MNSTSLSLLDRLKAASPEPADWNRLHDIYFPLIERWLGRVPGLGDESADLTQEVLIVLFRDIRGFDRKREGSFRAWLRQVTVNKIRNYCRERERRPAFALDLADGFLDRLSDPSDELACEWDRDHDRHVVQKILDVVKPHFRETTWQAFQRFGIEEIPAHEVAKQLDITENAVILAKSRVLKRLRQEAGHLL